MSSPVPVMGALWISCGGAPRAAPPFSALLQAGAGLWELHQWARSPLAWPMGGTVQKLEGRRARFGELFLCTRPAGLWVVCIPLSQATLQPHFLSHSYCTQVLAAPTRGLPQGVAEVLAMGALRGFSVPGQCPVTLPTPLQKVPQGV